LKQLEHLLENAHLPRLIQQPEHIGATDKVDFVRDHRHAIRDLGFE